MSLILSKVLSKLRWPLFLAYAVLLYITFTLPVEKIPPQIYQINDKLLHFLCFVILALLGFQAFSHSAARVFSVYAEGKSAAFSLFYGAFLEAVQQNVPGRFASFNDWLADAAGVLAAFLLLWALPGP